MRLITHLLICASLTLNANSALAAPNHHKPVKSSKAKAGGHKKSKTVGETDLWQRVRNGLRLPIPSPLEPEQLAVINPPDAKSTLAPSVSNALKPHANISLQPECSTPPVPKFKRVIRKLDQTELTEGITSNTDKTEITGHRVHARFEPMSKARKLYLARLANGEKLTGEIKDNPALDDAQPQVDTPEIPSNSIEAEMLAVGIKPSVQRDIISEAAAQKPCTPLVTRISQLDANNQEIESIDPEILKKRADNYARVKGFINRYKQNPEFLASITERARPYLYYIVEALNKAKLPMNLALLPIVESAYQPKALSPKSAAGLWQFIPSTGQDYHLAQSEHYDERLDIVKSTDAAVRFLHSLNQHFHGDWLLALAAYNCGPRTVDEAMAKNRAAGMETDFWSLSLPAETQDYVPRLLALSSIFNDPAAHGIKIAKIANEPYFARVNLTQHLALKHLLNTEFEAFAKLADISREHFNILNPGFLSANFNNRQPASMLVPTGKAQLVQDRLRVVSNMLLAQQQKTLPVAYVDEALYPSVPSLGQEENPYISLNVQEPISSRIKAPEQVAENVGSRTQQLERNDAGVVSKLASIVNSKEQFKNLQLAQAKLDHTAVAKVKKVQNKRAKKMNIALEDKKYNLDRPEVD